MSPPSITPGLVRRAVAVLVASGLAAGGLGFAMSGEIGLSTLYPVKCVLAIVVVAVFAAPALSQHGRARMGPANLVTAARAVLVSLLSGLVGESVSIGWGLVALAMVALAMDGLDGRVARRLSWVTDFGARLDEEVDAWLTLILAVLVWQTGRAGVWVLATGLMRYAYLCAMVLAPWLSAPLPPRYRRKVVCVIQIGSLILCLLPGLSPAVSVWLAVGGLAALVYSFGADVWWLWSHR